MKRKIRITISVLLAAALLSGCELAGISSPATSTPPVAQVNKGALEAELPAAYLSTMAKAKPKLLFFSTSYDPTSSDVFPHVSAVRKAHKSKIAVLIIDADAEEWAQAVVDHKVKYFPTVIVFDDKGTEVKRFEGYVDRKSLEKAVNEQLDR